MNSYQRKYLKGAAHRLKPVAFVGQKGVTGSLIRSIDAALDSHELIKVKFVDFKEKARKGEMAETLAASTGAEMIGIIGHVAIFYRQHADPQKRKIRVPERQGETNR